MLKRRFINKEDIAGTKNKTIYSNQRIQCPSHCRDFRDWNEEAQRVEFTMCTRPRLNHMPQPQTMCCNSKALFETRGTLLTLALGPTWPQNQIPSVPSDTVNASVQFQHTLFRQQITTWVHLQRALTLTRTSLLLHFPWNASPVGGIKTDIPVS